MWYFLSGHGANYRVLSIPTYLRVEILVVQIKLCGTVVENLVWLVANDVLANTQVISRSFMTPMPAMPPQPHTGVP
jgi:hypothetical protein